MTADSEQRAGSTVALVDGDEQWTAAAGEIDHVHVHVHVHDRCRAVLPATCGGWRARYGRAAVALAGVVAAVLAAGGAGEETPLPPFMGGVALGLFSYDEPARDYGPDLDEIAALGAGWVALVTAWYAHDVAAERIAPHPYGTLSDAVVLDAVRQARRRGLRVLLLPIVRLVERRPEDWRGRLAPRDWDAWWRSYEAFVLHHARLARLGGAEVLCIGSELLTTEGMAARWRALAARVRGAFDGRLLYSANWDHFREVTFWDAVDVVGLSAYFRLAPPAPPGAARRQVQAGELVAAWAPIRTGLRAWRDAAGLAGKPLVFTEVGYPALDGAAEAPWDETRAAPIDLEEQRRLYAAFAQVWRDEPALGGAFFWNWYGPGGPYDPHHNPRGKPAADEVRRFLRHVATARRGP